MHAPRILQVFPQKLWCGSMKSIPPGRTRLQVLDSKLVSALKKLVTAHFTRRVYMEEQKSTIGQSIPERKTNRTMPSACIFCAICIDQNSRREIVVHAPRCGHGRTCTNMLVDTTTCALSSRRESIRVVAVDGHFFRAQVLKFNARPWEVRGMFGEQGRFPNRNSLKTLD